MRKFCNGLDGLVLAVVLAFGPAVALASPSPPAPPPRPPVAHSFTILGFRFCVVEVGGAAACAAETARNDPAAPAGRDPGAPVSREPAPAGSSARTPAPAAPRTR